MIVNKKFLIKNAANQTITVSATWNSAVEKQGVVIFAHGFKGFRNWGHWQLVAETFAREEWAFVRFDFSHNGVLADSEGDISDLEAFGNNNYTLECGDLNSVLDWVLSQPEKTWDTTNINLIGHSRGGGVAAVIASECPEVKRLITWASVDTLGFFVNEATEAQWEHQGKIEVPNSRTGQMMPIYKQFLEDFRQHFNRFDLQRVFGELKCATLIIHGSADGAVPESAARKLYSYSDGKAHIHIVQDADHTFGGKHPWTEPKLHPNTIELVEKSLEFLNFAVS
jgi:pimeloyl-ACP methyl ester carboxylesterase